MKLIAFLLSLLIATPSFAAGCYSPDQFRAEQAIRYHTKLMIVGMRCQHALSPMAYSDYQTFTLRNQTVIRMQENSMIDFYKHTNQGNAERAFHTFRTNLANEMSMQANGPGFMSFCQGAASQLQQARTMGPRDFANWVEKVDLKQLPSTHPVCGSIKRKQ